MKFLIELIIQISLQYITQISHTVCFKKCLKIKKSLTPQYGSDFLLN